VSLEKLVVRAAASLKVAAVIVVLPGTAPWHSFMRRADKGRLLSVRRDSPRKTSTGFTQRPYFCEGRITGRKAFSTDVPVSNVMKTCLTLLH
jgi:hypothetical protein